MRTIAIIGNNKTTIKLLSILPLIMEEDYTVVLITDTSKMKMDVRADMNILHLVWVPRNKLRVLPGVDVSIELGQRVTLTIDGNRMEFNRVIDTRELDENWWETPNEDLGGKTPMEYSFYKEMHTLRKHLLSKMCLKGED